MPESSLSGDIVWATACDPKQTFRNPLVLEEQMKSRTLLRKPSALLPVLMSFSALAVVAIFISIYGDVQQQDEGTAAHLFQLLIALQIPNSLFFAFKWLPKFAKPAIGVLALQVIAASVALVTILILESQLL